jgi:hypothetical protein
MTARAAFVSLVIAAVAGCGNDCPSLEKQISAITTSSSCADDSDCAVYVGPCYLAPSECGLAVNIADGNRLDTLERQYTAAGCGAFADNNPGACACRSGPWKTGATACRNGACACVGNCIVPAM